MDTITITFPKIKLNTEIKDLSFDILEDMLFEISKEYSRYKLKSDRIYGLFSVTRYNFDIAAQGFIKFHITRIHQQRCNS